MLSCLLGEKYINTTEHDRDTLKEWASKNILKCPICDKPLEYCHGKIKIPYFRHKDKAECSYEYTIEVSEEHKQGELDLYNWIKEQPNVTDVVLEAWIPETKQRPDIFFRYKGQPKVIEYQCTPIATEYIKRHKLYKAAGIEDIWICGAKMYFQEYHTGNGNKRISTVEQCKKYYDPNYKLLFYINNKISEEYFNKLITKKTGYNFMKELTDYDCNTENYYLIKDEINSYSTYYKYPSPTGRRSNKYPYPVPYYEFSINNSLAICKRLDEVIIKECD